MDEASHMMGINSDLGVLNSELVMSNPIGIRALLLLDGEKDIQAGGHEVTAQS
jgi:hypothetical protein